MLSFGKSKRTGKFDHMELGKGEGPKRYPRSMSCSKPQQVINREGIRKCRWEGPTKGHTPKFWYY